MSFALVASPLAAQDEDGVTQASAPVEDEPAAVAQEADQRLPQTRPQTRPQRRQVLDLIITKPRSESDQLLEEDCEEEADAGTISNAIVVCRRIGEASDGSWDKADYERRLAERTQGEKPVNTFGLADLAHSISIGSAPEPVLIVDVEALPQAPAGSDADRIARGLPPLGQDEELSPEEIQRRRREAGYETPDLPGQ